jgi:hypothetical protein
MVAHSVTGAVDSGLVLRIGAVGKAWGLMGLEPYDWASCWGADLCDIS